MEWNPDATATPAEDYLILDTQTGTPYEIAGVSVQPNYDGNKEQDISKVLPFVVAVNESVGGEMAPADQLGWNTGFYGMLASRGAFNGLTIQPENSAMIFASQQYGEVGRSSRNETVVAQYLDSNLIYTGQDSNNMLTFITPGFTGGDVTNG